MSDDFDPLQSALRQLRQDHPPTCDLWPGIAGRIGGGRALPLPRRSHRNRLALLAMAASLLVGVAVAWHWETGPSRDPSAVLITREARAMTRDYLGALDVIGSSAPISAQAEPALRQLDDSAAQIRRALARDPDARFLLDRLQHTYAQRLALTRRAALS